MKKTTLFTTLALVVIVAIALSTATFAWYSSQSSVTANITKVSAGTAGGSIAIVENSKTTATAGDISLEFNAITQLQPAAMKEVPTDPITNKDLIQENFFTSPVEIKDGVNKFKKSGDGNNAFSNSCNFNIINTGSTKLANKISIKLTATKLDDNDKDLSDALRISVYTSTDNEIYTYIGTLSNDASAEMSVGEILEGGVANDISKANITNTYTFGDDSKLEGSGVLYVRCIVWYDGAVLVDSNNGGGCSVVLTINA